MLLYSLLFCLLGFHRNILPTTYNYIAGNKFRDIADYKVENFAHAFKPETIPAGSIVYVEIDSIDYFFEKIFSRIKNPIILITHNGDHSAPAHNVSFLDHHNIIAWFGQNSDTHFHPKFFPIPIGIANAKWEHGNPKLFDKALTHLARQKIEKKNLLYINFSETHPVRAFLRNLFKNKPFAIFAERHSVEKYLIEMAHYAFVLSPIGNGLDCHRTWEALLVGAIPVVKTSTLDQLYIDLPVIIVQDWSEITPQFLIKKRLEFKSKKFKYEKIFVDFWIDLVLDTKRLFLEHHR